MEDVHGKAPAQVLQFFDADHVHDTLCMRRKPLYRLNQDLLGVLFYRMSPFMVFCVFRVY